jgi:hypothetical protein
MNWLSARAERPTNSGASSAPRLANPRGRIIPPAANLEWVTDRSLKTRRTKLITRLGNAFYSKAGIDTKTLEEIEREYEAVVAAARRYRKKANK